MQKIDSLQALIETYDLMIKNKNSQMNITVDLIDKLCGILERVDKDGALSKYDDEFVNYVQEIVQECIDIIQIHAQYEAQNESVTIQ